MTGACMAGACICQDCVVDCAEALGGIVVYAAVCEGLVIVEIYVEVEGAAV